MYLEETRQKSHEGGLKCLTSVFLVGVLLSQDPVYSIRERLILTGLGTYRYDFAGNNGDRLNYG